MAKHERPHSMRVRAAIGALIAGGMLFAGPAGVAFAEHGRGNNGNGNGNNGGDSGDNRGPGSALSDGGSCPPAMYMPRSCSTAASGVCSCTGTRGR
jgi:hypothetical protein